MGTHWRRRRLQEVEELTEHRARSTRKEQARHADERRGGVVGHVDTRKQASRPADVEGRREVGDCVVSASEAGEQCRRICQVFAWDPAYARRQLQGQHHELRQEVEELKEHAAFLQRTCRMYANQLQQAARTAAVAERAAAFEQTSKRILERLLARTPEPVNCVDVDLSP